MSSLELRGKENAKIECARKFFEKITEHANGQKVIYDVVHDYAKLIDIVNGHVAPRS